LRQFAVSREGFAAAQTSECCGDDGRALQARALGGERAALQFTRGRLRTVDQSFDEAAFLAAEPQRRRTRRVVECADVARGLGITCGGV
jgi:hypothetical protein